MADTDKIIMFPDGNNGVAPQVISSMSGHVPNSKAFERYFNIEDEIKKSVVKNLEI